MKTNTTTTAAGCACRVPVFEVAAFMGATEDHAADIVRSYGHEVGVDWCGRPAVGVEAAAEVLSGHRAAVEGHSARWAEYQEYLTERRQAVEAERQAAAQKAADEALAYQVRYGKQMSAKREAEALAAAEQHAAEQAAKAGRPLDWATFARSKP